MTSPNWELLNEYFRCKGTSQEILKKLSSDEIKIIRDLEEPIEKSNDCDDTFCNDNYDYESSISTNFLDSDGNYSDDALHRTRQFYSFANYSSDYLDNGGFFDRARYEMDNDIEYQEWSSHQDEIREENRIEQEYADAAERSIQEEKHLAQYEEECFYEDLKEREYPLIADFLIFEEIDSISHAIKTETNLIGEGDPALAAFLKELVLRWEIYQIDYRYYNLIDETNNLDLDIDSDFEPLNEKDEFYRPSSF